MIVGIDGACKRNGKPDCVSLGAIWLKDDIGNFMYTSKTEKESTNQRGEINGLITALRNAGDFCLDDYEQIVIITDSEYLCKTITLEWAWKWKANNWIGSSGDPVKNIDLWEQVIYLVDCLGKERISMQWVKGHLISYTPGNTKRVMGEDISGVTLYDNIMTILKRPSEKDRVVKELIRKSKEHDISGDYSQIPENVLLEWISMNIMADLLAGYLITQVDALYQQVANK